MKKFFIVLALVMLVMAPVVAKEGFTVGIEAGQPSGITFGYQINDKINVYLTGGLGFGTINYIDAAIGGQYKVFDFTVGTANFDVLAGVQAGALFYLENTKGIALAARGTAAIAYNWTWGKLGDFTAYLRGGIGARFKLSGDVTTGLSWNAALGCVYHF